MAATAVVAVIVFGAWFLACPVLTFRAIRCDDVVQHRRWMIRAFVMGVGGTMRIWIPMLKPAVG